jgi:glycine/D-amino acid oxidase-like deaminating enzyme
MALAMELESRGSGSGADIVVLDKTGPGAGASGIACGCVRNLYMTEPIHAILRHSVDVWMYDPVAFGFQQVGYVSAGEANQAADYEKLHASQARVGYPSMSTRARTRETSCAGSGPTSRPTASTSCCTRR